jgi:hypothetical protein
MVMTPGQNATEALGEKATAYANAGSALTNVINTMFLGTLVDVVTANKTAPVMDFIKTINQITSNEGEVLTRKGSEFAVTTLGVLGLTGLLVKEVLTSPPPTPEQIAAQEEARKQKEMVVAADAKKDALVSEDEAKKSIALSDDERLKAEILKEQRKKGLNV